MIIKETYNNTIKKMIICVFLGFSSGLPLYFLFHLVPLWARRFDVDLKVIGLLSLAQIPYTIKFLWAPFFDTINLPFLGLRRGWLLVTQIFLFLVIAIYGLLNPNQNLTSLFILTTLLAFFSATQDIVIDAYRREILNDNELGLGNTVHVNAYRVSMLIPASLSLIVSNYTSWQNVFLFTAFFMIPGIILTMVIKEPYKAIESTKKISDLVITPLKDFFQRKGVKQTILILLFILLYKVGDSMTTALATPFYVDMGYSNTNIATVAESTGFVMQIVSGIIGGILMLKLSINKSLWLFGLVQLFSILGFVYLSSFGHFTNIGSFELLLLAFVIGFEATGVGLGTAAIVAFIARESSKRFAATQIAILTSIKAIPRTFINSTTGYIINYLGYYNFFILCFLLGIPGILLLFKVAPWNKDYEN